MKTELKTTLQKKEETPKSPKGVGWRLSSSAIADLYGAPDKVFHNWQREAPTEGTD